MQSLSFEDIIERLNNFDFDFSSVRVIVTERKLSPSDPGYSFTVWVGNLTHQETDASLKQFVESVAGVKVRSMNINKGKKTHQEKYFAHINFFNESDRDKARAALHETQRNGQQLIAKVVDGSGNKRVIYKAPTAPLAPPNNLQQTNKFKKRVLIKNGARFLRYYDSAARDANSLNQAWVQLKRCNNALDLSMMMSSASKEGLERAILAMAEPKRRFAMINPELYAQVSALIVREKRRLKENVVIVPFNKVFILSKDEDHMSQLEKLIRDKTSYALAGEELVFQDDKEVTHIGGNSEVKQKKKTKKQKSPTVLSKEVPPEATTKSVLPEATQQSDVMPHDEMLYLFPQELEELEYLGCNDWDDYGDDLGVNEEVDFFDF